MFYDQLLKICKERNVKPTPLIKSLGLSAGNLKRWQEGATVNSDILMMLSDYFGVSVDYFFEDYSDNSGDPAEKLEGNSMSKVYNVLKAHPDHIASMLSGQLPSGADLLRIAEYLNYSVDALVPESVSVENVKTEDSLLSHIPPKDMVLNIMTKLAASEEYNYLQVSISKIVISNLARKNIQKSKLESLLLSKKKLDELFDNNVDPAKAKGFNISDLVRISEAFDLSYDFMFTGENK